MSEFHDVEPGDFIVLSRSAQYLLDCEKKYEKGQKLDLGGKLARHKIVKRQLADPLCQVTVVDKWWLGIYHFESQFWVDYPKLVGVTAISTSMDWSATDEIKVKSSRFAKKDDTPFYGWVPVEELSQAGLDIIYGDLAVPLNRLVNPATIAQAKMIKPPNL